MVNAGLRHGRDAAIADMRAIAELGVTYDNVDRYCDPGSAWSSVVPDCPARSGPEAFRTELLNVIEIDADERIAAHVLFDPDDIDAAFAELDARYLAGEAAAHAHTWSVVAEAYAAFNRHELPATTPDWVNIDHRRANTFESGDVTAYLRAMWDLHTGLSVYVETVHRLSDLGAVVTYVGHGTSPEGFDAEWRGSTFSRSKAT